MTTKCRSYWGYQWKEGRIFIHRFSSLDDIDAWLKSPGRSKEEIRYQESASFNAIRKINRRIAAGETITFPVEID